MPIFTERQYFRQPFILLIVAVLVLATWAMFVQQIVRGKPVGTNPVSDWGMVLLTLLIGVGLPALLLLMHVRTTVASDRLAIEVWPFSHREIPAETIATFGKRTVNPIRNYGGWGIRGWGSDRAYLMHGDTGVQLVLTNGDRVLVGSSLPDELATAIATMKSDR